MNTVSILVKVGVLLNVSSLLVIMGTVVYKIRSVWKFSLLRNDSMQVFRQVKSRINEVMALSDEKPKEITATAVQHTKSKVSPQDNVEIQKILRKVEKLLTESDFEASEKLLVEALGFNPDDEDVTTLLAFIYYKRNKLTKAENLYVSLIERGTNEPGVYGNLAKVMEEQGKLGLAIAAAKEAAKKDSRTAGRYAQLGQLYIKNAEIEHAVSSYEEAMKYATKNTEYMFALSDLYKRTEQYAKADEVLGKILAMEPYNEDAKVKQLDLRDKGYLS